MRRLLALLIIAATSSAGPARGAGSSPEAPCVRPLELTPTLVASALEPEAKGLALSEKGSAVLLGRRPFERVGEGGERLSPSTGIVFLRGTDGAWTGYLLREGEEIFGAFVAPDGLLFALAMWATEGPGSSWTLTRLGPGGARGCVTIPFPATLNRPFWANEFLEVVDLDVDARGRGELIGRLDSDVGGKSWFLYATADGGETWGPPRRLKGERSARGGRLKPVAEAAPGALRADLERFLARRAEPGR